MAGPPPVEMFLQPEFPPAVNKQSVTNSPFANADPKYKRCTLNAIPNSSILLEKSRIPFGLLITPYRELQDGEVIYFSQ